MLAQDLLRNVTILGHVDHGKTTLTDSLLASNNIISTKMAGKLRYLDSREDEQERGITMQSSSIALKFQITGEKGPTTFTINIVDTPGHVDFSSEVSAASRLCDGALILVDVVEGVCTQTITVLRQAWRDQLKPVLVINKLDRLISELRLTPEEAYRHLARLIEQVNAVLGSFFAGQRMEDDWRRRDMQQATVQMRREEAEGDFVTGTKDDEERDDESIYFSPERGNIIFASAIDGWAFRVDSFAQLFSAKLGMKEATLRRVLWGDFFLDPKSKKITKHRVSRGKPLKPLFVQFVLENIWAVYEAAHIHPDPQKIEKIILALNLKVSPRELKAKESRQLLLTIFVQWLPITTAIVRSIIDIIPAPGLAQATRIPRMLHPDVLDETTVVPRNKLEADMFTAKTTDSASVCGYISKMFAISDRNMPRSKADTSSNCDEKQVSSQYSQEPVLLGFSRLYSGKLRVGTQVYCVLPKYDTILEPTHPLNQPHIKVAQIEGLYSMMGRDLVPVEEIEAGSIFAVKGLQGIVSRSATICTSQGHIDGPRSDPLLITIDDIINLGGARQVAAPILRVALEPAASVDMPKLLRGLELLSQSDPCVQVFQQSTGEHVILTAGELHLERCLRDLNEQFAQIDIKVSKPIVPFRETMVLPSDNTLPAPIECNILQGCLQITLQALPMPPIITTLLQHYSSVMYEAEDLDKNAHTVATENNITSETFLSHTDPQQLKDWIHSNSKEDIWNKLMQECENLDRELSTALHYLWAVGREDKGCGGCILVDSRSKSAQHRANFQQNHTDESQHFFSHNPLPFRFDSYIEAGFHLAVQQGPLCAEPMDGIAFVITNVEINEDRIQEEQTYQHLAQVASAVITGVKEACHNAVLSWSPRLMLAMYSCDIQVSMDVLGKVYGVVSKRHGQILAEEIKEGTSFFDIQARIPVVESFGFTDEIRKRTSGSASPQLIFNGFTILDQDPFWIPTTSEELEDLGNKADKINLAKKYMDEVRERKGLFVDRKVVEFAEKQRTLKK